MDGQALALELPKGGGMAGDGLGAKGKPSVYLKGILGTLSALGLIFLIIAFI
jgi:hypothetical protein